MSQTRLDRMTSDGRADRRRWIIPAVSIGGIAAAGLILYLLSAWNAKETIDGTYGRRRGLLGGKSVNGTAVLAAMFEAEGHRVTSWRWLSPRIDRSKVIVWAPDDFQPPDVPQRDRLQQWLSDDLGRTLVYIGRDYDAQIDYWQRVGAGAPAQQIEETMRRAAAAQAAHDQRRMVMPKREDCGWFTVRRDEPPRRIDRVRGPWSEGIDASKLQIMLEGRLDPPDRPDDLLEVEILLEAPRAGPASRGDALVMRLTRWDRWGDSQLIVVANGSFLLNLPLVNHEHRKLAGKLIEACGPPGDVVFLESGPGGPPIRETDEGHQRPTALQMLSVWPLGGIVAHLAVLGIILCFALFPIFGRPRRPAAPPPSDFARHVGALGQLLARTGDARYAQNRLVQYQQRVRRDSAATPAATTLQVHCIEHHQQPERAIPS